MSSRLKHDVTAPRDNMNTLYRLPSHHGPMNPQMMGSDGNNMMRSNPHSNHYNMYPASGGVGGGGGPPVGGGSYGNQHPSNPHGNQQPSNHFASMAMKASHSNQPPPSSGPPGGTSYRQYRDPRQFDSPAKQKAPSRHTALDDLDDVTGQSGSYGDDRIENELLSEICGDIGLDEAMDLDIFDFDAPAENYYSYPQHSQPHLGIPASHQSHPHYGGSRVGGPHMDGFDPVNFTDLDSTLTQGQLDASLSGGSGQGHGMYSQQQQQKYMNESQSQQYSTNNRMIASKGGNVGYSTQSYQTKIPSNSGLGMEKGEFSPYEQSIPSVKSSNGGDVQREIAIDSPTVSSSVPTSGLENTGNNRSGSQTAVRTSSAMSDNAAKLQSGSRSETTGNGSLPASARSSVGSPSVHSTTPSLQDVYDESFKPPSSASPRPTSIESQYSSGSMGGGGGGVGGGNDGTRDPGSPSCVITGTQAGRRKETRSDSVDSTSNIPMPRMHRSESVGSPCAPLSHHQQQSAHPHQHHSASLDNLNPSSPRTRSPAPASSTSSHKNELFPCYSQPSSPSKHRTAQATSGGGYVHKAQSYNENLHRQAVTKLQSQISCQGPETGGDLTDDQKASFKVPAPPSSGVKAEVTRGQDQGYFSQASSAAHYGSSSTLSMSTSGCSTQFTDSKSKVRDYLNNSQNRFAPTSGPSGANGTEPEAPFDISSHPSTADLNIPAVHSSTASENPSASSSQSNSPTSMHIAKRARVITTGNDLLADVREQFSYVKGADMFAPPVVQEPMNPQQRMRGPYNGGYGNQGTPQRMPLNMQVPSQFHFGNPGGSMPQSFHHPNQQQGNSSNMGPGSNPAMMGPNSAVMQGQHSVMVSQQGPHSEMGQQPGRPYAMNNGQMYSQHGQMPNQGPNPRIQTSGCAPNMDPGMYPPNSNAGPNNMYPSHSQSRAFTPTTGQPLDMQAGVAHSQGGMVPMGPRAMGPQGTMQQYGNNTSGYGPRSNTPKLDNMGNPVTQHNHGQGDYSNANTMVTQPYPGGQPYRYGNAQAMPGSMPGFQGNGNPGYRAQSPGYMGPGGANPGMMGSGEMGMHSGMPGMNPMASGMGGDMQAPYGNSDLHGQQGMMPSPGMPPGPGGPHPMGPGAPVMNGAMGPGEPPMGMGATGGGPSTGPPTLRGKNGERLRPPPEGLMQQIISDRSSAFRSHPLFPLLRDLIIADMNFNTPSFPFQLIANLPADFERLLQNYLNRNPPTRNQQVNPSVETVIMDALKYAHQSLIEKIQVKKQAVGYQDTPKPLSAIEDFCERFDRAVKNSFTGSKTPSTPSKSSSSAPRTPSKSSSSAAAVTPKKEPKEGGGEKGTPSGKSTTAGRNKVLPKEAVALMLEWLREHQDNPYPNDDEKEMLINKTKLSINQINYWFTNARRRILPKWALQRYMEQQQHSPFGGPRLAPM